MLRLEKNFKTIALKCRKEYNIKATNDLLKAKSDNVKKYWQMLKGNKSQNFSTINANDFKEYFCGLLNPNDVFYEADDDIRHFLFNYSDERLGQIFGIMDADISMEEMEKAISQLKNGKSGIEDLLSNE